MSEKKAGNTNASKDKKNNSVKNDTVVSPPVSTRATIAKAAGVSTVNHPLNNRPPYLASDSPTTPPIG